MSDDTHDGLPRVLRVLWEEPARPRRGPANALNLDRIVTAAIEIADADGLAALSMARLADRLGCATMSLYRHVANKDELLAFMMSMAPGRPPEIDAAGGWRDGLTRWSIALRKVYLRHPWILEITGVAPVDPGQLAWVEAGLRAFGGTALPPRERLPVLMLLLHYIRGHTQIAAATLRPAGGPGGLPGDYGAILARLVRPDRFPALAEVLQAGTFTAPSPAVSPQEELRADFVQGLDRILDGVAVQLGHAG
ncbi:TetR/AcrR family transcriptional regulator [Sphaerisporangium rufum]|uniref:TetR/AcrR family transcriptional regulator n=1 Tax=Sphaerisporangium rufum TaxID=1381558 RepID=UPI0023B2F5D8|nr:TetR/AcrR family transcriptional regulator [Sphaerisporangium rufum]